MKIQTFRIYSGIPDCNKEYEVFTKSVRKDDGYELKITTKKATCEVHVLQYGETVALFEIPSGTLRFMFDILERTLDDIHQHMGIMRGFRKL